MSYAQNLYAFAQSANVRRVNMIFQDQLLLHASRKGGMMRMMAAANKNGVCAALTVFFAEKSILGRLSEVNQNALAVVFPAMMRSQFSSSFFSLHEGVTKGNFEIAATHLGPNVFPVKTLSKGTAFETALEVAISRAAAALGRTVVIGMYGAGGHVIGLKVVPGGTSSFFDANAGLFQFDTVGDLKDFTLAAYALAAYEFTVFKVIDFQHAPPIG